MILSYIIDPDILNENNISNYSESILHLQNEIFKNSILIYDKDNYLKDKLIDNIDTYGKNANYGFVKESRAFEDFFKNSNNYYTSDVKFIDNLENKFSNFISKINNKCPFVDIFVNDSEETIDSEINNINFKKFSKNNFVKKNRIKFNELFTSELSSLDEKFIETMFARCFWNSKKISIYDQYIAGSIKWNNRSNSWKWGNDDHFKDRKKGIEYLVEIIKKYSLKKTVELEIITWTSNDTESVKPYIHDNFHVRKIKESKIELLKARLKEIIPKTDDRIDVNLILKNKPSSAKKHKRVLKTQSILIDLDHGIDLKTLNKRNNKYEFKQSSLLEFTNPDAILDIDNYKNIINIKKNT